jgi:LysR family transcriptional regulator, glycine cleavage system transcriptional activator
MSLPLVRLQYLDFVRGFVAVGRRMSITLAARDLCLTQSAVSRQIHALEAAMGTKLLRRGYRSVTFTPEGAIFFRAADIAIQQLQDVMGVLDPRNERRSVTITASIGVAGLWLLPRLPVLHRRLPGVDVRIAANDKVLDLRADGVDIAIRYCREGTEQGGAHRLFGEELVPIARASLDLTGRSPAEIVAGHVLLEFDDVTRPWLQWRDQLAALGLDAVKPKGVMRFNQYDQLIHAALAGQGIALGRRALVEPMLRDQRLVELDWGERLQLPAYGYWLLLADERPRAEVAAVAQWIREEAEHA